MSSDKFPNMHMQLLRPPKFCSLNLTDMILSDPPSLATSPPLSLLPFLLRVWPWPLPAALRARGRSGDCDRCRILTAPRDILKRGRHLYFFFSLLLLLRDSLKILKRQRVWSGFASGIMRVRAYVHAHLNTDSQLSFRLLAWILITSSLGGLITLKLLQSQILDIKGNTQLWHLSAAS